MVFGLILVAVGIIALLVHAGILPGSVWDYTWPIIIILLGLSIILGRFFWRSRWSRWNHWGWPNDVDKK